MVFNKVFFHINKKDLIIDIYINENGNHQLFKLSFSKGALIFNNFYNKSSYENFNVTNIDLYNKIIEKKLFNSFGDNLEHVFEKFVFFEKTILENELKENKISLNIKKFKFNDYYVHLNKNNKLIYKEFIEDRHRNNVNSINQKMFLIEKLNNIEIKYFFHDVNTQLKLQKILSDKVRKNNKLRYYSLFKKI